MIKKFYTSVLFFLLIAGFCSAADITGRWTGRINDQIDVTCDLKVDGEKLSGSMQGEDSPAIPITDGIIKGDDLSFNMNIRGTVTKVKGKLVGDVLTLSLSVDGNDITFSLKKSESSPVASDDAKTTPNSIIGHWTGKVNGQTDIAYDFKAEGEKISGSVTGPDGTARPISDVIFKDNELTFNMDGIGNKIAIKGKLSGEVLKLSFAGPNGDIGIDLKKTK